MGCSLSSCLLSEILSCHLEKKLSSSVMARVMASVTECPYAHGVMRRVVLVTRPEPGLSATMKEIAARGWFPLPAPMLEIAPNKPAPPLPGTALAITSAQALPFLQNQPRERLLLTVGKKTAQKAREAGFSHILSAEGNAQSLKTLCHRHEIRGEDLVLATGRGWDGQIYGQDLVKTLGAQRVEAYCVSRHNGFGLVVKSAFRAGLVDSVVFYSMETAAAFMQFCPSEYRSYLGHCRAFCLSDAIARYVATQTKWQSVSLMPELEVCPPQSSPPPLSSSELGEEGLSSPRSCPFRDCPNFVA